MSEIVDRVRARCEQARGQGITRAGFELADIEALVAEAAASADALQAMGRAYEALMNDNLDLIARVDENQERLDV